MAVSGTIYLWRLILVELVSFAFVRTEVPTLSDSAPVPHPTEHQE